MWGLIDALNRQQLRRNFFLPKYDKDKNTAKIGIDILIDAAARNV